jgi:hypothetical protein
MIEKAAKGGAKKKPQTAINQDFYTKSDGQNTVRSGVAAEMAASIKG